MRGRRLRAGARRRARRCTHVIRVLDDQLLFRVVAPEQLDLGFAVFNLVTLSGQVSAKSRRGLSFRARTHRPPGGAARGFRLPASGSARPVPACACALRPRPARPGPRSTSETASERIPSRGLNEGDNATPAVTSGLGAPATTRGTGPLGRLRWPSLCRGCGASVSRSAWPRAPERAECGQRRPEREQTTLTPADHSEALSGVLTDRRPPSGFPASPASPASPVGARHLRTARSAASEPATRDASIYSGHERVLSRRVFPGRNFLLVRAALTQLRFPRAAA